jgi:predicted nucleic acid-binding protein
MKRAVLWDSSAILALLDADDADHARAVIAAERIAAERRPSFITNYLEAETHALLLRKLGRAVAREWLLTATLPIVRVQPREEERARELIATYSDKDWSLCDAISFAVIELRNVGSAFSFDRHFLQHGRCRIVGLVKLVER